MDSLIKNNVTNSLHPYLIGKSPIPKINIQEINDLQNMYFHVGFDQCTRRPDVFRKSLPKWFAHWEKQNIRIAYQFIKSCNKIHIYNLQICHLQLWRLLDSLFLSHWKQRSDVLIMQIHFLNSFVCRNAVDQ